MEVDFTSMMRGLGSTSYDWNFVKENEGITLLRSNHPSGGSCFKIVKDFTTTFEKQLYPTMSNPAKDGNTEVERDAKRAYSSFDNLINSGISSDTGMMPTKAVSFKDLDTKLQALPFFDEDLVIELQRTGINDFGGQKTALNLDYPRGFVTFGKQKLLEQAKSNYGSFKAEIRLKALKDMRTSVLYDYLEESVYQDVKRARREMKKKYAQSEYEGSLSDYATNNGDGLLPDTPYAIVTVRFVDQNGDEVTDLPYTMSARGAINFRESMIRTGAGKNPGAFASGATLFEESSASTDGKHYLYRYKINDEVPHRGAFKIQIIVPKFDSTSIWANPRIKAYGGTPTSANDRGGSIIPAKAGIMLTSQSFRFEGMGTRHEVTVPIYREPIPNHLVLTQDGRLVSKWSTIPTVDKLPRHQKVTLRVAVSRLMASELWEKADKNNDLVIDQDEYQSKEGEAARQDLKLEEKIPVRQITVELRPKSTNTWLSSREIISDDTDLSGVATITAPLGNYTVVLVSKNASGELTDNTIGEIEIPAGIFYRETTENDTTPIALVGATMTDSYATVVNFNLKSTIPRIKSGMSAEYGSVYAIKSLPGIETGWPNNAPTTTDMDIFSEFEILLQPLPGEIALEGDYEDIDEEEVPEEPLSFGEMITITQPSTGTVVTGIDQTQAGTKWNISRVAVMRGASPTVQFFETFDQSSPKDPLGRDKFAKANIIYPVAQNMTQGDEYLVFYPAEQGDIIAYPTLSVSVSTPGQSGFTYEIVEIPDEPEDIVNNVVNNTSNALPAPPPAPKIPYGGYFYTVESRSNLGMGNNAYLWQVFSSVQSDEAIQADLTLTGYQGATQEARSYIDSLTVPTTNNVPNDSMLQPVSNNVPPAENWVDPVVINAVLEAENEGDTITANMLTSQAIIDAYRAGTLTYQQAYAQLRDGHGWSDLDITESLDTTSAVFTGNGPTAVEMLAQNNNANNTYYSNTPPSRTFSWEQEANNAPANNTGDGLPTSIVNQANNEPTVPNAVTMNAMATSQIINNYAAGNMTYQEAYSALEMQHGWSYTDITESLDPLANNHAAAVAAAEASAQQAANNAALFAARAAAAQSSSSNNTTDNGCYITTAVMRSEGHDESPELQSMRALRDNYGIHHYAEEVEEYYKIAPSIVSGISNSPNSEAIFKELYHKFIVPAHELVKQGKYEDAHTIYRKMVRRAEGVAF